MPHRATAIFLLVTMVVWLLKPVSPFIEYSLFKNYIATNLCVNRDKPRSCCEGKCHLKKQIEKNTGDLPASSNQENKKPHGNPSCEFLTTAEFRPGIPEKPLRYAVETAFCPGVRAGKAVFVPPKSIV